MPSIGGGELLIIFAIVLLIFGGTQLPKLARSLGEARREFEKSTNDEDKALDADTRGAEQIKADDLARREAELRRREDDLRGEEESRRRD